MPRDWLLARMGLAAYVGASSDEDRLASLGSPARARADADHRDFVMPGFSSGWDWKGPTGRGF
ncbi:hypothetical protein L593_10750 [Salinarchaeum sp. Harcht-Bsk1]|nr:hypothetical protein L593_10750 [Salinarchaeum sp. Harcht-Bsk1]